MSAENRVYWSWCELAQCFFRDDGETPQFSDGEEEDEEGEWEQQMEPGECDDVMDDILFYLNRPEVSVPWVMQKAVEFYR